MNQPGKGIRLTTLLLPQGLNSPSESEFAALTLRDLLQRIGLVRYLPSPSGFFDVLPVGQLVLDRACPGLTDAASDAGFQSMAFSPVQARSLMESSGRLDQFAQDIYELPGHGRPAILAPAHEEYFTELCKSLGIRSGRQMPVAMYMVGQVVRRQRNRSSGGLAWTGQIPAFMTYEYALDASDLRSHGSLLIGAFSALLARTGAKVIPIERGPDFIDLMVESEMGRETVVECRTCGKAWPDDTGTPCDHEESGRTSHIAMSGGMHFIAGDQFARAAGYRVQSGGEMRLPSLATSGFGLSRFLAVLAERSRRRTRMDWPRGLAPFDIYVSSSSGAVEDLVSPDLALFKAKGLNLLIDDRRRPDTRVADVLGVPLVVNCDERGYLMVSRDGSEVATPAYLSAAALADRALGEGLTL